MYQPSFNPQVTCERIIREIIARPYWVDYILIRDLTERLGMLYRDVPSVISHLERMFLWVPKLMGFTITLEETHISHHSTTIPSYSLHIHAPEPAISLQEIDRIGYCVANDVAVEILQRSVNHIFAEVTLLDHRPCIKNNQIQVAIDQIKQNLRRDVRLNGFEITIEKIEIISDYSDYSVFPTYRVHAIRRSAILHLTARQRAESFQPSPPPPPLPKLLLDDQAPPPYFSLDDD